jgi:branched-chain amino acid transport system ATP-binding protein
MLKIQTLAAGYGGSAVVRDVSLHVRGGEVVAVLGRNGSGRSTLVKALMGIVPSTGSVLLHDQELAGQAAHQRSRLGMGYVPETRDVFGHLTVQENLRMGEQGPRAGFAEYWNIHETYRRFPLLQARKNTPAGVLSGGEQQLLSLARTLMGQPRCLLLDEPLEGLSPHMVDAIVQCIRFLKTQGVALVWVEQKLAVLPRDTVDRTVVLGQGAVVFDGPATDLAASESIRKQWLEV